MENCLLCCSTNSRGSEVLKSARRQLMTHALAGFAMVAIDGGPSPCERLAAAGGSGAGEWSVSTKENDPWQETDVPAHPSRSSRAPRSPTKRCAQAAAATSPRKSAVKTLLGSIENLASPTRRKHIDLQLPEDDPQPPPQPPSSGRTGVLSKESKLVVPTSWTMPDGSVRGYGTLEGIDGGLYCGEWVDEQAHGSGSYKAKDGTFFEGQWLWSKKHGEGMEVSGDGQQKYNGQYSNGCKHGCGVFIDSTGGSSLRYEGEFRTDRFHGKGGCAWGNGRKFDGHWRSGKMHGSGSFSFPDGRTYDGEYRDDLKSGNGRFSWPDGRSYDGQWHNGLQHGTGTWTRADGKAERGLWQAGFVSRWVPTSVNLAQGCDNEDNFEAPVMRSSLAVEFGD